MPENKKVPLISVIIPVFNAEEYLAKCLATVRHQTHKNLEIIIVDDGSTDNSAQIYQQVAEQDTRFRIIRQANSGAAAARNAGLRQANGEYIHFMDADDLICFDYYEKMLASALNADADIACGGVYREDEPVSSLKFEEETVVTSLDEKMLMVGNTFAVWLYLFKKALLDKHKLEFDENIKIAWGEDSIFSILARYYARKMVRVPHVRYFYKKNSASISNANDAAKTKIKIDNTVYAQNKILQFAKEHNFEYLFKFD
jgi:glycosyltransferase involved in cell wall biosynthesis